MGAAWERHSMCELTLTLWDITAYCYVVAVGTTEINYAYTRKDLKLHNNSSRGVLPTVARRV
jgi:hypothetical protein